jgi:hypothetical protein
MVPIPLSYIPQLENDWYLNWYLFILFANNKNKSFFVEKKYKRV